MVAAPGRDPATILEGLDGFGVVALSIADLEEHGQVLVADPIEGEPDHALVVGAKSSSRMRGLSKACSWVIEPPSGEAANATQSV